MTMDLDILNTRKIRVKVLDLTFCRGNLMGNIWRVYTDPSLSDHMTISFELETNSKPVENPS